MLSTPAARGGLAAGITAYALRGVLPLYFPLPQPAGAVEIIAHRVVWSLLFRLALLLVTRTWPGFVAPCATVARSACSPSPPCSSPSTGSCSCSACSPTASSTPPSATSSTRSSRSPSRSSCCANGLDRPVGRVLGFGALAVVAFITAGYGQPTSWIALYARPQPSGSTACSRTASAGSVAAVPGMAAETLLLALLALGYLVVLGVDGTGTFAAYGPWHAVALVSSGVVTAVPLLLFNSAARRLPLSVVGLLQYLALMLQFSSVSSCCTSRCPSPGGGGSRWCGSRSPC